MQILIMTKTIKGKEALQKHYTEYLKLPRVKRLALERFWRQVPNDGPPYSLLMFPAVKSLNGVLDPQYLIEKTIKPIMSENGACYLSDYEIKVT